MDSRDQGKSGDSPNKIADETMTDLAALLDHLKNRAGECAGPERWLHRGAVTRFPLALALRSPAATRLPMRSRPNSPTLHAPVPLPSLGESVFPPLRDVQRHEAP